MATVRGHPATTGQSRAQSVPDVSRRRAIMIWPALAAGVAAPGAAPQVAAAAPEPVPVPVPAPTSLPLAAPAPASACGRLDPSLGSALLEAVAAVVQDMQLMPEEEFQVQRFKLQQREYPFYLQANSATLPRVPDLSDQSGGLSNPVYFNFVSYVAWKVAARALQHDAARRTAFNAAVGSGLLARVAPDAAQRLARAAAANGGGGGGGGGRAPPAAVAAAVSEVLASMAARGYCCGWQLHWGGTPGEWPADWADSAPHLAGEVPSASGSAEGLQFQVKLFRPADIEGCVALRAEEDGFWSRYLSSALTALLAQGGYTAATADEFFSQDSWSGPTSLKERLLLALGDPLQVVDIPWHPTTLVQDWGLAA